MADWSIEHTPSSLSLSLFSRFLFLLLSLFPFVPRSKHRGNFVSDHIPLVTIRLNSFPFDSSIDTLFICWSRAKFRSERFVDTLKSRISRQERIFYLVRYFWQNPSLFFDKIILYHWKIYSYKITILQVSSTNQFIRGLIKSGKIERNWFLSKNRNSILAGLYSMIISIRPPFKN